MQIRRKRVEHATLSLFKFIYVFKDRKCVIDRISYLSVVLSVCIAVGQWLVSGLQWSSSARQSLAARQKVLSE